jgi:hypothetical protein
MSLSGFFFQKFYFFCPGKKKKKNSLFFISLERRQLAFMESRLSIKN